MHLVRIVMQPLQRWQEAQNSKCLLLRINIESSWQTGALLAHKNRGRGGLFSISIRNVCKRGKWETERSRQQNREKDVTQGKLSMSIN